MFNSDEVEPFLSSDTDDTDSDSELQEVVKLYNYGSSSQFPQLTHKREPD